MDWGQHLRRLFEDGHLQVPPFEPLSDDESKPLGAELAPYEAIHRAALPGRMPDWDPASGAWAALMLLRAAQFCVYREHDEKLLRVEMEQRPAPASGPAAHYSVDVAFQYLPDLITRATAASPQDPLVKQLRQWAEAWPLSSVGVAGVSPDSARVDELCLHEGLCRLYVDRILARDAAECLEHSRVEEAVRRALGGHVDLAPAAVRQRLQPEASNLPTTSGV